MHIDTRPFRAGHSAAFLSKLYHEKIATKRQIARAYHTGCQPKELAAEYGISVQKVLSIVRWYDLEAYRARQRERASAPRPVIQTVEPETPEIESESPNTYVVHKFDHTQPTGFKDMRITLPLLSIQRGAALGEEGR